MTRKERHELKLAIKGLELGLKYFLDGPEYEGNEPTQEAIKGNFIAIVLALEASKVRLSEMLEPQASDS